MTSFYVGLAYGEVRKAVKTSEDPVEGYCIDVSVPAPPFEGMGRYGTVAYTLTRGTVMNDRQGGFIANYLATNQNWDRQRYMNDVSAVSWDYDYTGYRVYALRPGYTDFGIMAYTGLPDKYSEGVSLRWRAGDAWVVNGVGGTVVYRKPAP